MMARIGPSVPDLEGSGPFPASYAMAPNGLQFVVYQPIDLAGAEAKASLEFMSGAMADVLWMAPVRVFT